MPDPRGCRPRGSSEEGSATGIRCVGVCGHAPTRRRSSRDIHLTRPRAVATPERFRSPDQATRGEISGQHHHIRLQVPLRHRESHRKHGSDAAFTAQRSQSPLPAMHDYGSGHRKGCVRIGSSHPDPPSVPSWRVQGSAPRGATANGSASKRPVTSSAVGVSGPRGGPHLRIESCRNCSARAFPSASSQAR